MIQFSAVHQFADGHKVAAFQLQEMGESGTGSIEHGDASGDIFWLQYPVPFLTHYYNTFPEMLPVEMRPTQSGSAAVPAPSATRRRRDAPVEQGEQGETPKEVQGDLRRKITSSHEAEEQRPEGRGA